MGQIVPGSDELKRYAANGTSSGVIRPVSIIDSLSNGTKISPTLEIRFVFSIEEKIKSAQCSALVARFINLTTYHWMASEGRKYNFVDLQLKVKYGGMPWK